MSDTHLPPGHQPGPQSRRGTGLANVVRGTLEREAKGVSLQVEPIETARGQTVHVVLTVEPGHDDDGALQVGLVCTQFYDVKRTIQDQHGSHEQRVIERNDVVTDWRDVPRGTTSQTYAFTIPVDGPFSYEGATVTWAYRVSARRPREHRIDPHHDVPLWVRP
jgi:hypothetical protein